MQIIITLEALLSCNLSFYVAIFKLEALLSCKLSFYIAILRCFELMFSFHEYTFIAWMAWTFPFDKNKCFCKKQKTKQNQEHLVSLSILRFSTNEVFLSSARELKKWWWRVVVVVVPFAIICFAFYIMVAWGASVLSPSTSYNLSVGC